MRDRLRPGAARLIAGLEDGSPALFVLCGRGESLEELLELLSLSGLDHGGQR